MLKSEKGLSLIQVIITVGILGGLSLASMQLISNMRQGQSVMQSKSDEIELRNSIRMILNNERFCRISIAGEGTLGTPTNPVTFFKQDIDEDTEGLDIALYASDQAGTTRTLKKLNGRDNPGTEDKSYFGKLRIASAKLIMNNGTGFNYNTSPVHNDIGIIKIVAEKNISNTQVRTVNMNFNISLILSTSFANETTILGCSGQNAGFATYTYCQYKGGSPNPNPESIPGSGYNRLYHKWQAGDCNNGLPKANCKGVLASATWGGTDSDWQVLNPGESPPSYSGHSGDIATDGGIHWVMQSTSFSAKAAALYICY